MLTRIRQWVNRAVLNTETARTLLTRAGDAIREAKALGPSQVDQLLADEIQLQHFQIRQRMNEMLQLRGAELACHNPEAFKAFHESGKTTPPKTVGEFKERLWELELALEDRGWVRETTLAALEFSRYGVGQLIRITRVYAIKNPLIKRGCEICKLYVFGRGVEIRSEDQAANDTIQDFLAENAAELSHIGLAEKETSIQTDGSLYFALETTPKGVKVNMIDPLEMMEVLVDPDDTSKPLYFHRQWNRAEIDPDRGTQIPEQQKCWYPSLELKDDEPATKPQVMGGDPVNWDMPIYRVKVGAPAKWRWGIPPVYAAIDWARAYKDFLEDWATVQRTLSRFALMIETKGGPGAIAAYNALLNTTFADSGGTQIERNPPPVVGSAHIAGPDNKISAFRSAGAQNSPEQARRLGLQACAALGMSETVLMGDATTGSLATAVSLDRPSELRFREIQQRWVETLTRILRYVLDVSKATPGSKMREARAGNPAPQPASIIVKFPSVLEHDIKNMIEAVCLMASMGGRTGIAAGIIDRKTIADLCLTEAAYENRSELLDKIYGKNYDPAADVTDQRSQVPPQLLKQASGKALTDLSLPPPKDPDPDPVAPAAIPGALPVKPAEALREAVATLRRAVERRKATV